MSVATTEILQRLPESYKATPKSNIFNRTLPVEALTDHKISLDEDVICPTL